MSPKEIIGSIAMFMEDHILPSSISINCSQNTR